MTTLFFLTMMTTVVEVMAGSHQLDAAVAEEILMDDTPLQRYRQQLVGESMIILSLP
jgi:hypothetical protein